jgi:hypothetical protein
MRSPPGEPGRDSLGEPSVPRAHLRTRPVLSMARLGPYRTPLGVGPPLPPAGV